MFEIYQKSQKNQKRHILSTKPILSNNLTAENPKGHNVAKFINHLKAPNRLSWRTLIILIYKILRPVGTEGKVSLQGQLATLCAMVNWLWQNTPICLMTGLNSGHSTTDVSNLFDHLNLNLVFTWKCRVFTERAEKHCKPVLIKAQRYLDKCRGIYFNGNSFWRRFVSSSP